MSFRKKFAGYMVEYVKNSKICVYIKVECQSLTECSKEIENLLVSREIKVNRSIDPECWFFESIADSLFNSKKFIQVVELKSDVNRMFYVFSTDVPLELNFKTSEKFMFKIKKESGLRYLLKLICQGKIGGKRHRYRSIVTFGVSVAVGSVISSLIGFQNFLSYLISGLFALLLAFAVDYPFSVLSLKGVDVVESEWKIFKVTIRVRRRDKDVLRQLSPDSHK
ncbi:hypothetical protein VFC49_00085 [Thermococcus sp. SY098]|uniref:hypothetical protein n=1 Tax=Thermococcus sp. SY098 TaxID=3111325 RepID=UPI002D79AE46|nr:hypothetical protein [Thermococcus sp. SY098]WRS52614.1 hypothetical protein VFC49_00085 [Thermococcus sp. SY098]